MKFVYRRLTHHINRMDILIVFLLFSVESFVQLSSVAYSSSTPIKTARQLSSKCVCGIENTDTKLQRIIAGTEIKPELRFPWLVPLAYRNGSFFCGATLISSRYLMTSAHCFKYSKQDAVGELRYMISGDAVIVPERITSNMLVGLGVHNLVNDDHQPVSNTNAERDKIQPSWQTIDYAVVHRFYENIETAIRHDIALIRLRKEIDFDRFKWLRPICLPDEELFEMQSFNKFQLEQYVQPNTIESTHKNPALSINDHHTNNQINNPVNDNQLNSYSTIQTHNRIFDPINPSHNQLENSLGNRSNSALSNMFNMNDIDFNSFLIENNETAKSIERINSKRLSLDKLVKSNNVTREGNFDRKRRELSEDNLFFSGGWGSTAHSYSHEWKMSKVPLWMQLKMLTRERCIQLNGERVKWNFICAEGMTKEQETSVGDSGGPLFAQMKRKTFNMKNKNAVSSRPIITVKPIVKKFAPASTTTSEETRLTTMKPATSRAYVTRQTTRKTITELYTTSTVSPVIKYISKAPFSHKLRSKIPQQPQQQQQQILNELRNLQTKIKENSNRHFYSSMIYEDLFKALNFPHNDISLSSKNEAKDLIEGEDMENENNDSSSVTNSTRSGLNFELDLSTSNYVQLGIVSWSSYLNPEIGMYTDVRAYIGWIKRNTQDAVFCISNPSKMIDGKIPIPTEKPNLPESDLDCGVEQLKKVSYPWLTSLYLDDKFLGNCVYFFSNFVICSDIYADQTSSDINSLVNRFSVEFYYPNSRFRAKNIINRLMGSSASKREYIIIQVDDPENKLHKDVNREFTRTTIDSQINKNNPQASCISTRDYPMNEESSNLITFHLFAPGENLVKTQLKLTPYRRCRQLAPNFVTRRFLCAQIGASEDLNISDQLEQSKPAHTIAPNRLNAGTIGNTTSLPFATRLKNFFRIQSNRFNGPSNIVLKNELNDFLSFDSIDTIRQNFTLSSRSRALENTNLREVTDGQPVFHKIDEQYTLVGFLVKPPFPSNMAFRHNNLTLLLDLKKFRFQLGTKLLKSLRAYNRA